MPRYYFDVRTGDALSIDRDGYELSTVESVQNEAALSLIEMSKHMMRDRADDVGNHRMAVEVRSETGPVLQATFSVEVEKGT
jgi:hypothetical protein